MIKGSGSLNEPKILKLEPLPGHKLRLHYATGEIKLFDVKPYIKGPWFGELKNETYFKTVRLYPNGEGIEWKNGQDIAPHELYELGVTQTT